MPAVAAEYVELHAKSFYSFGQGASHIHELLAQAKEYGYTALALTDTTLCGGLEFARLAGSLGIQPITGGELTLTDGSRLTLLAKTRQGYANLSRLFTLANGVDRREPRLDPEHLSTHVEGIVLLTGGSDGPLSKLMERGHRLEAVELLRNYLDWYGRDSVYVELQQNFLKGDTARNRELASLAREVGVPLVATNDVHYHIPERYRLQHALVAAKRNTTIEQALPHIRPNHHLCLKSPGVITHLFRQYPEAIANTLKIAEQCTFNLSTDLGYTLPQPAVPEGYTAEGFLERLCQEAALRRYGSTSGRVEARLQEEFRLIRRHGLAGFLLLYREIVLLAQRIMEEQGLAHPEIPLEERPPGRGRGSSVALLVGYLIGISHVDPIKWNLTLERFISEDMTALPDIDLDFPRNLRDELMPAGAQALRSGIRRPHWSHHHLLGQGHHPGPGQGIGTAQRGPPSSLQAAPLPRCHPPSGGDASDARIQREGRGARVEGSDTTCPSADGCPEGSGSTRGRDDPQRFTHLWDGAHQGWRDARTLYHGLEQGQRSRRRLR